nr:MAG: hypothetical protein [Caudoviricetes sp.]
MRRKKRTSPEQDYLHFLAYESTRRLYKIYELYYNNVWGSFRSDATRSRAMAVIKADRILNDIL